MAEAERGIPERAAPMPFRAFYLRLEEALAQIAQLEDVSQFLELALGTLLDRFHDELGFEGGRIYTREGEDFVLSAGVGSSRHAPLGIRVPRGYPPHLRTLEEGVTFMRRSEAGIDGAFETAVGVGPMFAAIAVGKGNSHVIAFSVTDDANEEQIVFSLTAVRHVISLKLQQMEFSGMLQESRAVQDTILPAAAPPFPGYEMHGKSRPADLIGGDVFDFLPLSDRLMGIAVADSSGHNLPSALLARDVITGLRMGAGLHLEPAALVDRLNRVINRAALATKFVSLFYGELSAGGEFHYCNAGHNLPLLLRERSFLRLHKGGVVLGLLSNASYSSAGVRLLSGDLLFLYTDGVTEREDGHGVPFGVERLQAALLERRGESAAAIVDAVLQAVDRHGGGTPAEDDMTVLAVRRL